VSERAEGLPLAVEEVLAELLRLGGLRREGEGWVADADVVAAASAPSIEAMVAARIRDLMPSARAAAVAAALLDEVVTWQQIAPIAALDSDAAAAALRALTQAQVMESVGAGRCRYRHGLIREALLGAVPPSLVRESAERAARGLGDSREPESHAKAARLFALADVPREAARHFAEACRRWLELGALRSAEAAARDALLLGKAPVHLTADPNDLLSECLARMGRFGEALELLQSGTGADLLADVGAEAAVIVGERGLGSARVTAARLRAALCALEIDEQSAAAAWLDLIEQSEGISTEVMTLRARLAYNAGDRLGAARMAELAVELAEAGGTPEPLCAALHVTARVMRAGDPADAFPVLERLYELAVAEELAEWRERALLDLGLVDRTTTGHFDRLRHARDEAAARGALHTQAVAETNLWPLLLDLGGDIEEAQLACDHAVALATRYDLRIRGVSLGMQTILASLRGRPDLASEIAERIGADMVGRTTYEVFHALCTGEAAEALSVLRPYAEGLNASLDAHAAPARGLHALLSATEGLDADPAEQILATGIGTWLNRGLALLALAVVAGRNQERERADVLSRRAAADLETTPSIAAIAVLHVTPHALADGWGTPADWLRAAHTQFTHLGNIHMRYRCAAAMRAARIPVPRRGRGTADVPAHLRALNVTSREMDVLVLLAQKLTNSEIAEQLSLSPRTVESHVSRLLTKTGQSTRTQLARLLEH
jgi:DNA-binding CsgD family transcriptional regulator